LSGLGPRDIFILHNASADTALLHRVHARNHGDRIAANDSWLLIHHHFVHLLVELLSRHLFDRARLLLSTAFLRTAEEVLVRLRFVAMLVNSAQLHEGRANLRLGRGARCDIHLEILV